jgi:4-alpha-glucanotransferase
LLPATQAAWCELAAHLGVLPAYVGWQGESIEAPTSTLVAMVLALLPEDIALNASSEQSELTAAVAQLRLRDAVSCAPPVLVNWDSDPVALPFSVPAGVDGAWRVVLTGEDGQQVEAGGQLFDLPASEHVELEGQWYCQRTATIAFSGLGYHQLRWSVAGNSGQTLLISAPLLSYQAPISPTKRWGVFAPLYALGTSDRYGFGDLGSLQQLLTTVRAAGGHVVSTLPLLAGFYQKPCEISPYSPASRMFWNELYMDCEDAARRVAYTASLPALPDVQLGELLNHESHYAAQRARLQQLSSHAWAAPTYSEALTTWAEQRLGVIKYAVFRALGEQFAAPWSQWPGQWRDGRALVVSSMAAIPEGVSMDSVHFHVFVQWLLAQQLTDLANGDESGQVGLYLDLPVGVNANAYEVWCDSDQFIATLSVGAPPDEMFLSGQSWGLPPLHPQHQRRDGYRYMIACVREHMKYAAMLRIDHVMGLFRLFCVPAGETAAMGAYLTYPADELLAIVCLESHRARCVVVGENLGVVPPQVPIAMQCHGIAGLYVAQFGMHAPTPGSVASLNTHDTATFAGWWQGSDIIVRHEMGLITESQRRVALEHRRQETVMLLLRLVHDGFCKQPIEQMPDEAARCAAAMHGLTAWLANSDASLVLMNLEDLWLEPRPQNVPGTSSERPNWQRPFARSFAAVLVAVRAYFC